MLKTLVRTAGVALLALCLATAAGAQQAQPLRIAVVDLDLLVAQSKAGQDLQARLTAFENQVKSEGEALAAKARATRQLIADGANSLSEDRLAELQKQYEDETIAVRRFSDDKQRQGQKMQAEGLRAIEQQLEPVFEALLDEFNYDLILNRMPGVVVMANERVDITPLVVERFNAAQGTAGGGGQG